MAMEEHAVISGDKATGNSLRSTRSSSSVDANNNNNAYVSTGPLARPFSLSLARTGHSFACSAPLASLAHSLTLELAGK